MTSQTAFDDIVSSLTADLSPVSRILPPALRTAAWLALVATMGVVLASSCDLSALERRLMSAPDMWISVTASVATAVLAGLAAFELSVPGRSPRWALLPLPSLILWCWASGLGCLRTWAMPADTGPQVAAEVGHCFTHILMMSVPLMAVMMVMVRRACPLRPRLTALVAGLAIAAASASLLNFDHPFDASASDLLIHLVAVLLVITVNQLVARRTVAYSARA
ncbi:MAG: NrsF family protein [Janthinobacterium lividum]